MNFGYLALLFGALTVAILCRETQRCVFWVFVFFMAGILSLLYEMNELPYAPIFVGFVDILVCVTVYFVGESKWEMLIWRLYQLSVGVSIMYVSGILDVHMFYALALEVINWAAILVVLVSGAFGERAINASFSHLGSLSRVPYFMFSLREKRKEPPFYKKKEEMAWIKNLLH